MDGGDNDRYVALKDTSEIHPFDTMTSFCGNKRQYSENQVFQEVKKPTNSNVNNKSTNNNIYSKTSPQCTLLYNFIIIVDVHARLHLLILKEH
jgi:hypothetical protein